MSARYPASPAPLSDQDTYTTWPGGVDPTARVYDSVGGRRRRSMTRAKKTSTRRVRRGRKMTRRRR
jgi:hypothetical protein